ncbi:RNA-binding protein rnc1 [Talaromyces islandicus]|uniref:RNA-binding protein rnc1 n=1 Tax=Talaromyces islandicus TaxID=28573 RepID=A0A0U1LQR9_TALIS|nr:RNA-binding protein rnc1 [Talaromyces islandicus]
MALPEKMKAVVFNGPYSVSVEERPVPHIQDPTDVLVKVKYTALCGSELHVFRGHQPSKTGFIMGHEFTGTVVAVRVPWADGTLYKAPEGVDEKLLVLMADIFPTGYFAASNGFKGYTREQVSDMTAVVIGCGPVGLLAIINALEYKPKHLLAIDSVPARLEQARNLGAEPWNFQTDREGLDKRVKELTDGRGADVVIEVVGLSPALRTAFDLLRPWGTISSVGVHNAEIPWTGNEAYGKNLRIQMGRCPVRTIFPRAVEVLKQKQHLLGFMADKIMPLSEAVEGYDIFDKMKAQKVGTFRRLFLPYKHASFSLFPVFHSRNLSMAAAPETHETDMQVDDGLADSYGRANLNEDELDVQPKTDEEYAQTILTLRAIVSSKEAGVIIGKAGKNVADLRDETGVKAGVSKVVQGVHDRVLTVTGGLQGCARAYSIVAKGLLEGAPQVGMGGVVQNNGTHPIRLLISHNQMGTIIGRQGLKIKHIQDASGVRMVAQKEMLPQSTERIVEVQGTPEGIEKAIWEIGKCLLDDWQRGQGTVLYNPAVRVSLGGSGSLNNNGAPGGYGGGGRSYNRTGNGADFSEPSGGYNRRSSGDGSNRNLPLVTDEGEEIQTQNISIPSDMVGCIIGRGGTKISEIRRSSGARISIAKAPHDETGERMFTIMGSAQANEKALYLLYENLEAEKMRRSQQPQE